MKEEGAGIEALRAGLVARNGVFDAYFAAEAPRLAAVCREMSRRFLAGGRLLAFGTDPASATDAAHVAVEFVHPVIVGKRALPAVDVSGDFARRLPVLARENDVAMGFGYPAPGDDLELALAEARERGALTIALTCDLAVDGAAEHVFLPADPDPFLTQEAYEILYHVLWETVHVFFERREQGHDVGAAAFLYPMLGREAQGSDEVVAAVEGSMREKAAEGNRLRAAAAGTEAEALDAIARAIRERAAGGGTVLTFGNGGSATDAADFAADLVAPPVPGLAPIPALSLAAEPATLTALANDIGEESLFARQLIALGRPGDIAVAFSASGSSRNLLAALAEARRRGLLTAAFVGYDGGKIVAEGLADYAVVVRSDYVPRIQEVQASLYHEVVRGVGAG